MNERLVPEAEAMSIKAEQITKLNLYNEQFASENYQIMNYGLGGKISPHVDSIGRQFQKNDFTSGKQDKMA